MPGKKATVSRSASAKKSAATPARSGVVVVGSLNMDLVVKTETMPTPGQTVMGREFQQIPGGKGANQAAAAGKLNKGGAKGQALGCKMIGRVGDDAFGQTMQNNLRSAGVDTNGIRVSKNTSSGVALITVDRHGENTIVVSGGANQKLDSRDLLDLRKLIEGSAVLAVQLETPFDTVACAIVLARQAGTLTILDPAPAPEDGLPESLLNVDIISPNQTEAQLLTGVVVKTVEDARRAGVKLLERGAGAVVLKMGGLGAVIVKRDAGREAIVHEHVPGFRVKVVDSTAAGDSFTGALAVALAEGRTLTEAVRFANAAGALACTKFGAQSSIPTRGQVDELMGS